MEYDAAHIIEQGQAVLGMELGSTRIKSVLIGPQHHPLASGGYDWENSLTDDIWTYSLEDVWTGVAGCFANLKADVVKQYNVNLSSFSFGGFSAMMHGYLAFDRSGELLVPFRTWRNNITGEAARVLTELLEYPIPQRWSIAHLYQAILEDEPHVKNLDFITTLSGYVHWKLTGEKILGMGDASGMFPINLSAGDFDFKRIDKFNRCVANRAYGWKLKEILPEVRTAGEPAGRITEEGALLLDPTGQLKPGIPLCAPEGDAGTGMTATNSVRERSGNVSAGTSVFAMVVMSDEPKEVHDEIDLVATPDGKLAGMVHSNNCTSDYDAWIGLLGQAAEALGASFTTPQLYDTLLEQALEADPDCGGYLAYGYVSGEHITGFREGRPLFVRPPNTALLLGNFIRTHLFTALCALRTGLDVLTEKEGVQIDEIRGHGGFFKSAHVGQRIMAAATRTPVSLLSTAGEGGAWGMALLAAFAGRKDGDVELPDYLDRIMADGVGKAVKPHPPDVEGFNAFLSRYHQGLSIEAAAVAAANLQ